MKKLASLLATSLVLAPVAATAQVSDSDTGSVSIDGRVAPICILGDPAPALVDLGQLAATSGMRIGRLAVLAPRTVTLPASFCNFAGSAVRLDATALLGADTSSPQPGFARAVNYTATASGWASGNAEVSTNALGDGSANAGSGTGATQPLPKIADIGVTLSNFSVPGDLLLVAGNYSGTVIITLGPAVISN